MTNKESLSEIPQLEEVTEIRDALARIRAVLDRVLRSTNASEHQVSQLANLLLFATIRDVERPAPRRAEPTPRAAAADCLAADCVDRLVELVFYRCYDWIVDDLEPELDQDLVRRRARRRLDGMAGVLRTEIERRGLSPRGLSHRLGWAPGRLEKVLSQPGELTTAELDLLVHVLRLPAEKLFKTEKNRPKELTKQQNGEILSGD